MEKKNFDETKGVKPERGNMNYGETGAQGHPEPNINSDGFHSFDKDGWIPIAESLPGMGVPVWLWWNHDMFIGCRTQDVDGWIWAECYRYHWNKDRWYSDEEDKDKNFKPTYWKRLPMPPEGKA